MLEEEQHARRGAQVARIDQHRTTLHQVALALERQIEHGIEQRMTGADEGGERLAGRGDQRLVEDDALVPGEHRVGGADLAIALANGGRHMGELVAAALALADGAAEAPEGLEEERLHVVWLQAAGLAGNGQFNLARQHCAGLLVYMAVRGHCTVRSKAHKGKQLLLAPKCLDADAGQQLLEGARFKVNESHTGRRWLFRTLGV